MKAKELLEQVISTGYSMSTMQKIFNAAHNEQEAEQVFKLIKESKTEQEILQKLKNLED